MEQIQRPTGWLYAETGRQEAHHSKWEVSIKSLSSELREICRRWDRKRVRTRRDGWKTPGVRIFLEELKKAHINSQRLKQQAWGIQESAPGPQQTYSSTQFCVFMGFLSMWTSVSLILVISCGIFSFCWHALSNVNVMILFDILSLIPKSYIKIEEETPLHEIVIWPPHCTCTLP